jgi:ABC-type lipoprotein release transport system permease subunit
MTIFSPMLWLIAARSLWQHRLRTVLLVAVIGGVTSLLIVLTGIFTAMQDNLLVSATTLMSGHVNVAGFFKANQSQSAPIVTDYRKVLEIVKAETPQLDYIVQRGRGWAKLVSDTRSMQVGIGGIDIEHEPGFQKVIQLRAGSLEGLKRDDGLLLFEEQATKLEVKVGDKLTFAAPTFKGTNNTVDVTVVAIAANVGLLSSWNTYMSDKGLRRLYQLNDQTTGALQLYLKDIRKVKDVQEHLRKVFGARGYEVMDADARPFFAKFDSVNRESWTGQKLDITNWEDETSFVKWFVTMLAFTFSVVIIILVTLISVGIMNVMWITIRERTREIGTLRAVGMQRTSVLAMFVTEGFLLGILGTSLGGLTGVLSSAAVNAAHFRLPKGAQIVLMNDNLAITPSLFWLVAGVGFITTTITLISILPSLRAARMEPISAMSHVG